MFIETAKLIDQTIRDLEVTVKNLETLSELLAEEVDEATINPPRSAPMPISATKRRSPSMR